MAYVIGDEAALKLFIRFNGRLLIIPKDCPPGHIIEQTIGFEKASLLCSMFKLENLLIPKGTFLLRKIRNQNIIKDWHDGMNQQDIATKYDLSCRQINTIINHNPMEKPHV